ENNMPFLQGTTLYGAANRTNFYNGYYVEKYGDLVEDAKDDIREAIKLCAIECAQGRDLEKWEVESILAYLWEIDLKIGDLQLTDTEREQIEKALSANATDTALVQLIKDKYLQASPATFVKPPKSRKAGYKLKGDPANGQLIYEASCLHCHDGQRYSFFNLNDEPLAHKFMIKHISRYTRYSLYQVGRYGTYPLPGKRAYMPLYTEEKMSNQQMEDLRAYMEKMAKNMQ
ncbi:MAG: cytochrome c, partial [Bacteroidota bacterium]